MEPGSGSAGCGASLRWTSSKFIVKRMKRQANNWNNIFAKYMPHKELLTHKIHILKSHDFQAVL